jgi:uncharacterized repeat protein (TIGR03833 family)
VKQEAASPLPPKGERNESMHGNNRKDITPGLRVNITQKQDQRSGRLTSGVVKDILTTSAFHSRGIKVRLATGEVGRVQEIVETSHTQVRDD